MLYYLLSWINHLFAPQGLPGGELIRFITFRSAAAAVSALAISLFIGPRIIERLRKLQVAEQGKTEAPKTHLSKAGTPMMGGLIILFAALAPTLLWADIGNLFIIVTFLATAALGAVGFLDDYLKVVKKKKKGLVARYKLMGQIAVGLMVGLSIMLAPGHFPDITTATTMPFFKNLVFEFGNWLYIPFVIVVITATSNAVNITDGLDGLASGTVAIAFIAVMLLAYFTGNLSLSTYLNIPYLRGSGELTVFCAALIGAVLGFLWFNAHPAQVFMGDTGSLALGSALGTIMVLIKKEFVLPIVGGIFFLESLSVISQTLYFKYTRKRFGEGKRIFKMAPIHHHFELIGWPEEKIVTRAYIVAILLAILMLTTFKVR
ncbi:MAG TPA: phospho-N-acetylmuramoyl-pentapeptide-transferase [Candidatus Kapabacteria bacterium]|nr:phospho-N-acetylmuramoyl-pentapeptide-transferase [Candidatus Kapabacteria bacterium]